MTFTLQSFLDEAKAVAAKLKQVDYVDLIDKAYTTVEVVEALNGAHIVTGKQIGRASCRERVSSPV